MAQMRDVKTSELLAEGTPLEIATAAQQFAADDVVFDDVGPGFDPAAVRAAHAEELAGLQGALADLPANPPKGADPDDFERQRQSLESTIEERQDRVAAGEALVPEARELLEAARDRIPVR